MEKQTMGKFIAALRKTNGMTQAELAEKLNVSNKSVSKWECDDGYPDLSLIPVIAEIFNVTSDEILKGARNPQSGGSVFENVNTEKQTNMLAKKTISNFKNLSIISIALTVMGLIFLFLPVLADVGRTFAIISLILAVFFILASVILQLIFSNRARMALFNAEETEKHNDKLVSASKTIENFAFHILTVNAIFTVGIFFLYLIGLNAAVFLFLAPLLYLVSYIVKMNVTDKKYYDLSEKQKSLSNLNFFCGIASIAAVIVTIVLRIVAESQMRPHGEVIVENLDGEIISREPYVGTVQIDSFSFVIIASIFLIAISLFYIIRRKFIIKKHSLSQG